MQGIRKLYLLLLPLFSSYNICFGKNNKQHSKVGNCGKRCDQGAGSTSAKVSSYRCLDIMNNIVRWKDGSLKSKRFCIPIGDNGGYGWPYWHGYPGVGTGLWGWGWPWIKHKVPGSKGNKTKPEENKEANKGKFQNRCLTSKRFCVPVGDNGGYGWPYWHGYPGVGTGLWGWGWPWIKHKVPGSKGNKTKPEENKESNKAKFQKKTPSSSEKVKKSTINKKSTIKKKSSIKNKSTVDKKTAAVIQRSFIYHHVPNYILEAYGKIKNHALYNSTDFKRRPHGMASALQGKLTGWPLLLKSRGTPKIL